MGDLDAELEQRLQRLHDTAEAALASAARDGIDAMLAEFNRRIEVTTDGGQLRVDVEVRVRLGWSAREQ